MEKDLLKVFGQLVKENLDSGTSILDKYIQQKPKNPSEGQKALLDLLENLDSKNLELLKQSVKYCIELSLFGMINTLEYGVADYSFELVMKKGNEKLTLIDDENDNDLTGEYWDWIESK
jgi:hypothetical protein